MTEERKYESIKIFSKDKKMIKEMSKDTGLSQTDII
jgi:hypothetical protein